MKITDLIAQLCALHVEHGDIEVFVQHSDSDLDRFNEPEPAVGRMNDAGYKELESENEYCLKWSAHHASDELAATRRASGMSEERIARMRDEAADYLRSYKEHAATLTKLFISL